MTRTARHAAARRLLPLELFYQLTFSQLRSEIPRYSVRARRRRCNGHSTSEAPVQALRSASPCLGAPAGTRAQHPALALYPLPRRFHSRACAAIRTAWMHANAQKSVVDRIGGLGRHVQRPTLRARSNAVAARGARGRECLIRIQDRSYLGSLRDEGNRHNRHRPVPERKADASMFDREEARPHLSDSAIRKLRMRGARTDRYRVTFSIDPAPSHRLSYVGLIEVRPWKLPRTIGQEADLNKNCASPSATTP